MTKNKKIDILFLALIVIALFIRLVLAVAVPGEDFDIKAHRTWVSEINDIGLLDFYAKSSEIEGVTTFNLPPATAYLFSGLGLLSDLLLSGEVPAWLLKLPAIGFDILIGLAIYLLLRRFYAVPLALLAACFFLFNPGVIYNSACWGQIDSIFSFFLLLAFILLAQRREGAGAFFLAISLLLKLQAIVFVPLFLWLVWRRRNAKTALLALLIFLLAVLALAAPFIIDGRSGELYEKIWQKSYHYTSRASVNAFNLWGAVNIFSGEALEDNVSIIGAVTTKHLGLGLFSLAYVFVLYFTSKATSRWAVFFAGAFIACSFFLLPTEIHERYLYPTLVFLPLCFPKRRLAVGLLILGLSFTYFINLILVYPLLAAIQSGMVLSFLNIIFYIFMVILMISCREAESADN